MFKFRLATPFLGILASLASVFSAESLADEGKPKIERVQVTRHVRTLPSIRMARATWDTGWFQAEIYRQLLLELGYQVDKPRTMENEDFYPSVAEGQVDFWVNGWFPTHNSYLTEKIQHKISLVGFEVKGGALEGYLIDKRSAQTLGIRLLTDLRDPDLAARFDLDGNGRADLVGCNEGWGCAEIIEYQLNAYGLSETVEHLQGDYTLLMHDVVARFQQGRPILFFTWTPNWTVGTLVPGQDVVWLEVPFPALPESQQGLESQTAIAGLTGCPSDPCNLGWPPNDIRVVANRDFLKRNPAIDLLLQDMEIPLRDIHDQNALLVKEGGSYADIERHAASWIADHRRQVSRWLTDARSFLTADPVVEPVTPEKTPANLPTQDVLRVATMPFEPLVVFQGRRYTGFSVELWNAVAEEMEVAYEFYGVNSLAKLLDDVERGQADVATAGIGITSQREMTLDFSHPFFESGLQIMIRGESRAILEEVISVVMAVAGSRQFLYVISFLILVLLAAAHVIWLSERRHNPQFPQGYVKGIWESFWWSAVTVTTVGYGDKTPKGSWGRAFALVWMFSGFFILAYFTASVTSTVTVQQLRGSIQGPRDLFGKSVATVQKSTASSYLRKMGVNARRLENVEQAIEELKQDKVDAVVYDAPVLQYYASHKGDAEVQVVGPIFWKQEYGIALQHRSPYREQVNQALLRLIERGRYRILYENWFGSDMD